MNNFFGAFLGTTLIQSQGQLGGARSVFVKLAGSGKDDLLFPTHGGKLMNPFKGAARIFAGDLFEYRTNEKGEDPVVYLLKTYKCVSASGATIVIENDGYKHVPFVGDVLMVAPSQIGGAGNGATVTAVKTNADGNWEVTLSAALAGAANKVLVEGDGAGNMLVKNINAVAACDYTCGYEPATDDNDFHGARYHISPALGGLMYIHKMSPLPECVLALNTCKVNGWFKVAL